MKNERAGATAAYLLGTMAPPDASRVLITMSSRKFEGEDARRVSKHFSKHYRLIDRNTQIEETEISIACPIALTWRPAAFPA